MGLAAFPLIAAGVCCLIVFVIIYVGFSARQMSTMGMVSLRSHPAEEGKDADENSKKKVF